MRAHFTVVFAALTVFFGTQFASAQTLAESPLSGIYACKVISEPLDRLACYDASVEAVNQKEVKKEIVTIDSTTAKTFKREAFGFSIPSLPKLGLPSAGGDKDDNTLELAVSKVDKSRAGITITMKNGQVWREVSGRLNYIPRGDVTARITKGSFGSYRLSLSNGKERVRGLGVRRVK